MTLEDIKQSVANENGFDTWSDLMSYVFSKANLDPEDWFDKVAKRYAIAVAGDLRERIAEEVEWLVWQNDDGQEPYHHKDNIFIDRGKIRKTEIILK